MIIAITGHRPQKLEMPGTEQRVKQIVHWALQTCKAQWLISGMALGVDQWAVEEALLAKVPVLAAIPCLEQEKFWAKEAKAKYFALLGQVQAAGGTAQYVSQKPYEKHVMQVRNMWMVDRANVVVAIFDGTSGGTANCVKYAIEQRKPILRYDPVTSKSEWIR